MNQSVFRFQNRPTQRDSSQWERLKYEISKQKIRAEMSNFDKEIDKLHHYQNRNLDSLNYYLQLQLLKK